MTDIFELFRKLSGKPAAPAGPVSWLIAGLGNPGEEYRNTRHNAGFLALDALAGQQGLHIDRMRFHALTAEATLAGTRVLLLKPMTYMNESGLAVREAAAFYRIPPGQVLVLSDDISLPPGRLRVRRQGSAGGHNGLRSIIRQLGTEEFPRIRLGVGAKPTPEYDLADWVLSALPPADRRALDAAIGCALQGVPLILHGRFDDAAQLCNSHRPG